MLNSFIFNRIFFVMLQIIILQSFSFSVQAKQIHKERSIYRNIVLLEKDNVRCMSFETRKIKPAYQACIDLVEPERLLFEYTQGLLAGYAINPEPERILIIGLGGGTMPRIMHKIYQRSEIISVEIDPVVVKLAKQYFRYQENDKVKTVIKDGRVFVKRALLKKEKFDWIILDAFNGDYIPEHLMTREFLSEVKGLLKTGGILSSNTFSNSRLFDHESVTYQSVFGKLHIFQTPTKGNRVIFACNCQTFNQFPLIESKLQKQFELFDVDLNSVRQRITDEISWDQTSRVLTDQYSPANLLKR